MSEKPIRRKVNCKICARMVLSTAAVELCGIFANERYSTVADALAQFADVKITLNPIEREHFICLKKCYHRLIAGIEFQDMVRNVFMHFSLPMDEQNEEETATMPDWDEKLVQMSAFSPKTPASTDIIVEHVLDESREGISLDDATTNGHLFGRPFVLPSSRFIKVHMTFDNFEYVGLSGLMCCGCSFIASNLNELMDHATDSHVPFPGDENTPADSSACDVCCAPFEDDQQLIEHRKWFRNTEVLICKFCSYGFALKEDLMKHLALCVERIRVVAHGNDGEAALDESMVIDDQQQLEGYDVSDTLAETHDHDSSEREKLLEDHLITQVDDYDDYSILHTVAQRCCGCTRFFANYEELMEHARATHRTMDSPPNDGEFPCEVCGEHFRTNKSLKQHSSKRNTTRVFYCKLCELYFLRIYKLARHFLTSLKHQPEGDGDPLEKRHDAQLETLLGQQKSVKTRASVGYGCCFLRCNATFDEQRDLHNHVEEVHAVRRGIHVRERKSDRLVCETCQLSFNSQKTLHYHRSGWQLKKDNICSYCGKGFTTRGALKQHEQLQHTDTAPQFECEVCGKRFKKKSLIKLHLVTHQTDRKFGCEQCGSRFHFRHQLKKHRQAVHTTEFPYECKHCGRKMPDKSRYDLHMRMHTGEKPYECRHECGRMFSNTTDRRRHEMMAHTGEKPHRCPVCMTAYVRRRELQLHFKKNPAHNI